MRVVPRRTKGRQRPEAVEPQAGDGGALAGPAEEATARTPPEPRAELPGKTSDKAPTTPSEKTAEKASEKAPEKTVGKAAEKASEKAAEKAPERTAVLPAHTGVEPVPPRSGKLPKQSRAARRAAKKAAKKEGRAGKGKAATPLPASTGAGAAAMPPDDPDQKRRARSLERQRRLAQVKRDRKGLGGRGGRGGRQATAAREHRSALLIMILTLGLLIAAVAVTGGLIASSMRTRPVTLAAPLHIYPVAATVPGQCQAGTQGISWPSATGPTCYVLTQGIAIRRVADLRLQRGKAQGAYDVALTLRTTDRRAFADLTRAMVGKDLAFVVRDRLVTVPRVEMPISDGKVVITGTSSKGDAEKLVRELKG
ncbi:hypothetical protein SMC26_32455 [Actinomadura fulvescens]|uniref:SecDF P1 head subdomain domain-containing protein n=1 Tax=Actinomadura fulvescens TaxID=46160 RepID=A0ABN3PXD1_9ACTN